MVLEQRVCVCGCGMEFRCMKQSGQKYASIDHQAVHTGSNDVYTYSMKRKKGEWPKVKPPKEGMINVDQAAALIGVSAYTVRRWAKLRAVRFISSERRSLWFWPETLKSEMEAYYARVGFDPLKK